MLLTPLRKIAEKVQAELYRQVEEFSRSEEIKKVLDKNALVIVKDLDEAAKAVNRIAPEHLELMVEEPHKLLNKIKNAGAIFLGAYSPEPISDYYAGPNHVLPTAGTARYASALSVDHFTKKTSLIHYSPEAFKREARDIICLAEIEGLNAHANAVRIRSKK